jgi:hypothetical protein
MFNSVVQTPITTDTETALVFNTVQYDTSDSTNMADVSLERFIIRKAGIYEIAIKWGWAGVGTSGRRAVYVYRNSALGSPIMADERPSTAGESSGCLSGVFSLAVNDFIAFGCRYTGTALGIGSSSGLYNVFTVVATITYVGNT